MKQKTRSDAPKGLPGLTEIPCAEKTPDSGRVSTIGIRLFWD
jgi:hypothetical protein